MMARRFILGFVISGLMIARSVGNSDPVGDFFKKLGNSLSNAGKHQTAKRSGQKTTAKHTGAKDSDAQPSPGASAAGASPSPSASPSPMVRAASAATDTKGKRRDLPYGIPVPGKPGFVTSPFAPDAGVVDVRQFPSGTEVKDPYTGRMFLTP
jgi:hypothetical protein